jgi:acyl carrier protein
MSAVSPGDVRIFLRGFIQKRLAAQGQDPLDELPDDCDLLLSGVIDSLGLLELVTAVNEHYGREIDFEDLDPEQMTIVGPLCDFVADRMPKAL